MWNDLSFRNKSEVIRLCRKHGIDNLDDIRKFYNDSVSNKFDDGGNKNPMNYEIRGTIHDDDLKKQGITQVVNLPEVTVTSRHPRNYRSSFNGHPEYASDIVGMLPVAGDALDAYNAFSSARQGNYLEAGLLGTGLLLPNALERPARLLMNKFGKETVTGIARGITSKVPKSNSNQLSQALIDKGWTIGADDVILSPNGERFMRNSEGRLVSEESMKKEFQAKKSRQKNILAPLAAQKEAKRKANRIYDELDKMGIKDLREENWFQGRTNGFGAVTDEDYSIWRNHLPEYKNKAIELINNGSLYQDKNGMWFGKFDDIDRQVNPAEYIVGHSDAFKKAGLEYDGINKYRGMSSQQYNDLINTGGLGHTTWTTTGARQGSLFAEERAPGKLVQTLVSTPSYKKYVPNDQVRTSGELLHGIEYSPNVQYRNTVGDYYKFGHDKQMKSIRGNNGNFDMSNMNIFKGLVPLTLGTATLGYFNGDE